MLISVYFVKTIRHAINVGVVLYKTPAGMIIFQILLCLLNESIYRITVIFGVKESIPAIAN